jgi:eukaryotic-like serine/threonine-protein kinase
MNSDRDLLFGVLAVEAKVFAPEQFTELYRTWMDKQPSSLKDFLVGGGWLTGEDSERLEKMLQAELERHQGDIQSTLHELNSHLLQKLGNLGDSTLHQSVIEETANRGLPTADCQLPPGQRYRRLHKHAAGGIGQVWLAHDDNLDRDVALKELRPEKADDADLRTRFLEEARITGQLEHPGIVPVYELARDQKDEQPFYVMRFVKGRTLSADILAYHSKREAGKATPLDLNGLLQAFVGVCQAVAYAHARNVIHRDLKGSNVILGDFGEVMVLDWGLAKKVGSLEPTDSPHTTHHSPLTTHHQWPLRPRW